MHSNKLGFPYFLVVGTIILNLCQHPICLDARYFTSYLGCFDFNPLL